MDALQSELWNEALLQLIQDYRETEIVTVTNEDAIGVMDYLFPLHNKFNLSGYLNIPLKEVWNRILF